MTQRIMAIEEGTPVNDHSSEPERRTNAVGAIIFSVAVILGVMLVGTLA